MESLLDFMYSGKVEVEKRSLGDLLKVAAELKVQGLMCDFQFLDKNAENDESPTENIEFNPELSAEEEISEVHTPKRKKKSPKKRNSG